jgi:5S rRNA maturation endonuclease (ribonuclease M5)
MPLIPRDHKFKTIPLGILDDLGWRWDKNSYFIPYFSSSKDSIPFAQWRHLSGERRFTFLKDAKPTCYGTWNLDNPKLFVVEGTSDCAALDYCGVPWIGLPSASSGELMKKLAKYCLRENVELIYAGDNDAAGEKLREALDEVMSYRVLQARHPYKDWGEMLEAEGIESIVSYTSKELGCDITEGSVLNETNENDNIPIQELEVPKTALENVLDLFPGAIELKIKS